MGVLSNYSEQICYKIGFIQSNTQIYCSRHDLRTIGWGDEFRKILDEAIAESNIFSTNDETNKFVYWTKKRIQFIIIML